MIGLRRRKPSFRERYGPWGIIAGASDGLGAAYAHFIAARGLNVVLVARRREHLEGLAGELRSRYAVETRALTLDLASPEGAESLIATTRDLETGLLVYVASKSNIGGYLETPLAEHLAGIQLNCRGPAVLAHHFGQTMRARGRGGIVLLSSFSGLLGCPWVAHYAATKAYNLVLAQSLWHELRPAGVHVLGAVVGWTLTPQSLAHDPDLSGWLSPPAMSSEAVVEETFQHLGRRGSAVIGRVNRVSAFFLEGFVPRGLGTALIGRTVRRMFRLDERHAAGLPREKP